MTDEKATFYLRKDALWSDGKPVTAHDFVFATRRDLTIIGAEDCRVDSLGVSVELSDQSCVRGTQHQEAAVRCHEYSFTRSIEYDGLTD